MLKYTIIPLFAPIFERNLVPDFIIRIAIRIQLHMYTKKVYSLNNEERMNEKMKFIKEISNMEIAIAQDDANDQHYEVSHEFHKLVLGKYLKYSSGYWVSNKTTLDQSEIMMLGLYCERAEIKDGMRILDLGCGWGR
jgi:cyclopropane-fatty-acyl-phospholipid synthase